MGCVARVAKGLRTSLVGLGRGSGVRVPLPSDPMAAELEEPFTAIILIFALVMINLGEHLEESTQKTCSRDHMVASRSSALPTKPICGYG
eukprot:2557087-Amphidinium_carterae.1